VSYGRLKIYTDATEITAENVVAEVSNAYATHCVNQNDISRLWDYYRGKTKIQSKTKEVREDINHKINENRAYEIVRFHKGYVFGEPIQYVRRENSTSETPDDVIAADINALNGYMVDANKSACDNALAEWLYVGGTGYRMTLPNRAWEVDNEESPFKVYALDPRKTFVVYRNDIDETPIMGVHCVERTTGEKVFSVYTDTHYFEFVEHGEVTSRKHMLGMIPIVEYPANNARLGVFEIVVPLLDALDELQSNRMDDIVQFVNSFLAILGGQLDEETYNKLNDWKTLCLPEGTDAKYLSPTMSQSDIQTLKSDLYQSILTISGVPNRNGGSSTSDTGSAVILRDGWETAEAGAKVTEDIFKCSEKMSLKLVLRILRDTVGTTLRVTDIVTHFTRRNYDNIASKSQVLIAMLNNPNIHPELAFTYSGMFIDPESAYLQSMAWKEENERKAMAMQNEVSNNDPKTSEEDGGTPEEKEVDEE
jgi:SPP1 family phage portal protein